MARFGEVFSTTTKVVVALVILCVGAGIIYSVSTSFSNAARLENQRKAGHEADASFSRFMEAQADDRHTKVPESKWNALVGLGIKQHCAFEGMTRDEVMRAVGSPTSKKVNGSAETWNFVFPDADRCTAFKGEKCVSFVQKSISVQFTSAGHAISPKWGGGCLREPLMARLISLEVEPQ